MISSLAHEIAKWIAEHHGKLPSAIRISQAVFDECIAEAKLLGEKLGTTYPECDGTGETKILGIPVLVDPTLTIGKIDP